MMAISAFEVLGPIMVGPSSSHTAGALRIAAVARSLSRWPVAKVTFTLYNSFARTYHGHGTDRALVAGMLGLTTDDPRIRDSFELAREAGLGFDFVVAEDGHGRHPNTVVVDIEDVRHNTMQVTGESLGGGRVRVCAIGSVAVDVTGEYPTLLVRHRDQPGVLASLTGALSREGVNIATVRSYRTERGGEAYSVFETDEDLPAELVERMRDEEQVNDAFLVHVPGTIAVPALADNAGTTSFSSAAGLLAICDARGISIGEAMREREVALIGSATAADEGMARVLSTMCEEVAATIDAPARSLGGFLDGQAKLVSAAASSQVGGGNGGDGGGNGNDSTNGSEAPSLSAALLGDTLSRGCAYAMATLERSASMGVIVAAPTAGSAGVVPGALIAAAEATGASDAALEGALWCAAAVGAIVSTNATVSGAEGGCQAEVGTAAAMAAAGLCELLGGTPRQAVDAAALSTANTLGLVCDPVGGLVEYPCQNRNAAGVASAFVAAQLALSGIKSVVPLDEAIGAQRAVGRSLPPSLRETALGGLAATPSAQKACSGCEGCSL